QWRQKMDNFICCARDDVFFGHCFESVSDGLQDAIRADAVWTVAILDSTQTLAFQDGCEREEARKHDDNGRHREEGRGERLPSCWRKPNQPMLQCNKNLVRA